MNDLMKCIYTDLFEYEKMYLSYDGHFIYDDCLSLSGCTSLTRLPDDLQTNGFLDLEGCVSLTNLPDGLQVGRNLYLSESSKIKIPKDIVIKGEITYI